MRKTILQAYRQHRDELVSKDDSPEPDDLRLRDTPPGSPESSTPQLTERSRSLSRPADFLDTPDPQDDDRQSASPRASPEPSQITAKRPRANSEESESPPLPRPRVRPVKRSRIPDSPDSSGERPMSTGADTPEDDEIGDNILYSDNVYHRELLDDPEMLPDRALHTLLGLLTQESARDVWRCIKADSTKRGMWMQKIQDVIDEVAARGIEANTDSLIVPDLGPPPIPSDTQYDFDTQLMGNDSAPPLPETQYPPSKQQRAMQAEASAMHSVIAQEEAVAGSSRTAGELAKSKSQRASTQREPEAAPGDTVAARTPRPVRASQKTSSRAASQKTSSRASRRSGKGN